MGQPLSVCMHLRIKAISLAVKKTTTHLKCLLAECTIWRDLLWGIGLLECNTGELFSTLIGQSLGTFVSTHFVYVKQVIDLLWISEWLRVCFAAENDLGLLIVVFLKPFPWCRGLDSTLVVITGWVLWRGDIKLKVLQCCTQRLSWVNQESNGCHGWMVYTWWNKDFYPFDSVTDKIKPFILFDSVPARLNWWSDILWWSVNILTDCWRGMESTEQ